MARLTGALAQGIPKLLDRRGMGPDSDPEESDSLRRDEPWLARLYAAAVTGRTAYGPNAGRRQTRVGDQIDPESMDFTLSPRCATVDGFSLHANGRPLNPALPVNPLCVTCMAAEAFKAMVANAEKSFAERVREAEAQQKKQVLLGGASSLAQGAR
jgi:hypothetical protein